MIISLIVAAAKNWAIGKDNHLLWKIKDDMDFFTSTTTAHVVIMGAKTYESIPPAHRPLPDRVNIVVSRDKSKNYPNCLMAYSLAEAFEIAKQQPNNEEVFVCGGSQIYKATLGLAQRVYRTEIDVVIEDADAFFPELDAVRWKPTETGSFEANDRNQYPGKFLLYERTGHYPIVEPANGRNETYRAQLSAILESGVCPFCEDGVTFKEQPIVYENSYWYVSENAHPLKDTLYHLIIVTKRHVQDLSELTMEEWQSFSELKKELSELYPSTGNVMYVRSGETMVTGATVSHLHFQMIVPVEPVSVNFGHYLT